MNHDQYIALREAFDAIPDDEKPTAAAWVVMRCGPVKALEIAAILPLAVEYQIEKAMQPKWARDITTEAPN